MTNDGPPLADQDRAGLSWWDGLTKRARTERRDSHSGDHPQTIIVISPAPKPGRFLGNVDGELIVTSRQPSLDGARALLARGYDPATPYNMRHAHSDTLSFVTTTIGHAAGLSTREDNGTGIRFQKFIPFERSVREEAEEAAE